MTTVFQTILRPIPTVIALFVVGIYLAPWFVVVLESAKISAPFIESQAYATGALSVATTQGAPVINLSTYKTVLSDSLFWKMLRFGFYYSFAVTAVSILLGTFFALWVFYLKNSLRNSALFLVLLTKFANLLVIIYGLKYLLSPVSPVISLLTKLNLLSEDALLNNHFVGATISETLLVFPYITLLVYARLRQLDPEASQAARILGAGFYRTLLEVQLPQCRGVLGLSVLLSFIWSFAAFASPLFLGPPSGWTFSIEVQRQIFENNNWSLGAATGVLSFASLAIFTATVFIPIKIFAQRRVVHHA